jgi:hypothetical protein
MSPFEYAMVLISIIVGLGITHILGSFSNAVHRLRHHGSPIRLEVTYLTWVAFIFTWLLNFWWWEFKWNDLTSEFGIGLFMFLALYAIALFSVAVILVPDRLTIVDDSWVYFLSIRAWFYGGLLTLNLIDLIDTFMKGTDWGSRTPYLTYWTVLTVGAVIALTTTRRSVHTAFGIVMLLWSNGLTVYELDILGKW